MTVKPGDRNREATEDDLMCEELPGIVDIEAVEGSLVQPRHGCCELVGQRVMLRSVHVSSERETDCCYTQGDPCCRTELKMLKGDLLRMTIERDEVTHRNPAGNDRDQREEHQRTPHDEGNLSRLAAMLGILLIVAVTPEDDIIENI